MRQQPHTHVRVRVCSKDMAPGAIIGLRGSMVKFESHSRHLEVCTFAAPLPFSLNRQIIMALRTLGVPDETFLDIYAGVVERLDCIEVGGRDAERVRLRVCWFVCHRPACTSVGGKA